MRSSNAWMVSVVSAELGVCASSVNRPTNISKQVHFRARFIVRSLRCQLIYRSGDQATTDVPTGSADEINSKCQLEGL